MAEIPILTDRTALMLHRARASKSPVTFLQDEIADEIEERLEEVNKSFAKPAIIGPLNASFGPRLNHAPRILDSEKLDLGRGAHDLILHAFSLHWANDPVGQIAQSRLALEPDGLFLAVMAGGQTLHELRSALAEAETVLTGGLSPRVLPMADMRDLGALIQRAGLALPVADSRRITVRYRSLHALIGDLRGMGETNALASRHKRIPPKRLFQVTEDIYKKSFADNDGFLLATFEFVFRTGWAPDESQQKPLHPGSAKARLADVLGVDETPTGENAAPRTR